MNDIDVEFLLNRIFSGVLYFYSKNELYELRSCTNNIKYQANLIYKNIINEEKFNNWIREENIVPIMISLGLWTKNTQKQIETLEKQIDDLKVELYKNASMTDNQKKIRKVLFNTKAELSKWIYAKNEFASNTLEGYANSIKNEYIICNTLYKNNKRVFDNSNSGQQSYIDFNELVNEINKNMINIDQFKFTARHSLWRSYWSANKNNVFMAQVIDWTDDQRTLVNISRMYDSIYENPDCPSEKIINDDDMLDGWMIYQKRKIEKEKNQKNIDELNPRLQNASEVFLFANNTDSFTEISDLNSGEAKYRLNEKINFINKNNGSVDDSVLPDVRRDLLQKQNELIKNRK
jgi:hypothetical protein